MSSPATSTAVSELLAGIPTAVKVAGRRMSIGNKSSSNSSNTNKDYENILHRRHSSGAAHDELLSEEDAAALRQTKIEKEKTQHEKTLLGVKESETCVEKEYFNHFTKESNYGQRRRSNINMQYQQP